MAMQNMDSTALDSIIKHRTAAKDSLTWYDYDLMYGRHFLLTATPESVVNYSDRAVAFTGRLPRQTPRTNGLTALAVNAKAAYHYLMHHNPDSTIAAFRRAYLLLSESDIKEKMPDVCANVGDAYVEKNDITECCRWYRKALFLADSLDMPEKERITLYLGLGRVYTSIGEYQQAKLYYDMADKQYDNMRPNMQTYFLNNFGNYYYFRKEYENALQTFRRMRRHLEKCHADDSFDMHLCNINTADVFLNLHDTDSSRHYLAPAEEYFTKNNVAVGTYYAHTIRIGIALEEHRFADIQRILDSSPAEHTVNAEMRRIRNSYVNKYYAMTGDYKNAYASLREEMGMTDSLDLQKQAMRTGDIMARLAEDTIRLHHQLEISRQQALHKKQQYRLTNIVVVLLMISLLFTLLFSHERKKKLQEHIDAINLSLQNARQRISPHFIFNVLNSQMASKNEQDNSHLLRLARLIRQNLDITSKTYVTLTKELDFVRHYVSVEQTLLGRDFTFTLSAPPSDETDKVLMPSMLVQIMTENAIVHGLKDKEGEKLLSITVSRDDEKTTVTVSDNGPGFDVREYRSRQSRTGLNIIRKTLDAINSENKRGKLSFGIHNDNGCHATLTIPNNIKLL